MKLDYKYQNFYEILQSNAKHYPNKTIIYTENKKLTNKELLKKVDTFASFLNLSGIKPKEKVALILNNSEYFVISLFAVTKIGAVAVPVNNFLKKEELEYILSNCGAKLLIAADSYKKELRKVCKH